MKRSVHNQTEKKTNASLLMIAAVLLFAGSVVFFLLGNDARQSSTSVSVDEVRALATLATAEAKVTLVKEEVDYKFFGQDVPFGLTKLPGTERNLLLVIPATVVAGIDLKQVDEDDFQLNEETKEVTLTLPRATFLQEPTVVNKDVKAYADTGFISGGVEWDEGFELAAIAQEEILAEAEALGVLQMAEDNAVQALQTFFEQIGYTVKVTFK